MANRPEYNFIQVLEQIEVTSKTNDKIEILSRNAWDTTLRDFLVLAVCETKKFNITEWSDNKGTGTAFSRMGLGVWENFLLLTKALMSGDATGHAANDAIVSFLSFCTPLEVKWFSRCLKKDIASTKIGRKIMDDVWPGSVLYWKCGLAEPEDKIVEVLDDDGKFIEGYAYVEKKKNGVRTFFEVRNGVVKTPVGRSGLPIENFKSLIPFVQSIGKDNVMFDGEVSCDDVLEDAMSIFGFDFNKTEANFIGKSGKVSKKWAEYQERKEQVLKLVDKLKFTIFAIVPIDEWDARNAKWTYEEMREELKKLTLNHKVNILESYRVETYVEAAEISNKWISEGCEGAIVKSPTHTYQFRRWRCWIKLKEEVETDFQITGYVLQKPKYNSDGSLKPPMVGKFTGYDQAGRFYSVGTGKKWNEDFYIEALENFETKYKNRIMKITAQRFTEKAAICPRFDIWRDDKTSLED